MYRVWVVTAARVGPVATVWPGPASAPRVALEPRAAQELLADTTGGNGGTGVTGGTGQAGGSGGQGGQGGAAGTRLH